MAPCLLNINSIKEETAQMIQKESFGRLPDGKEAALYTLTNANGVKASFTDLGAVWVSMMVKDRAGRLGDVVLGYDSAAQYLVNAPHFGAPIGRNANRIGGAYFELNGQTYHLEENNGSCNNLHSGSSQYHRRMWEAETFELDTGSRVTFTLTSPDGDQGFPGNLTIRISYTLTEDDSLQISYYGVADADTVVNLTNHSYFNLNGHDSGCISDLQVWIDADAFTMADAELIPTGELVPVKGTPMDFTVMKPIGQDIDADYRPLKEAGGYDHNWVLKAQKGEPVLAAKAYSAETGRTMEVYTDMPGLQFYTANSLDEREHPGKGKALYGPRSSFCFETQYFPNAVNIPAFVSPVLRAGEEYESTTIYRFLSE